MAIRFLISRYCLSFIFRNYHKLSISQKSSTKLTKNKRIGNNLYLCPQKIQKKRQFHYLLYEPDTNGDNLNTRYLNTIHLLFSFSSSTSSFYVFNYNYYFYIYID